MGVMLGDEAVDDLVGVDVVDDMVFGVSDGQVQV